MSAPVESVTLVFTGPAEPTGSGFEVLDPDGYIREPTEATTSDGSTWVLRFDPPLGGGLVGLRWMVKAPDAHPIDGSLSFTVDAPAVDVNDGGPLAASENGGSGAADESDEGEAAARASDIDDFLDAGGDTSGPARRVATVGRLIALLGVLVGVGGLVFATVVLRGDRRDVRYVLHWVRRAGIIVVIGAAFELVAQLALEAGGDWSGVWSAGTMGSAVGSSFGVAIALRVAGGIALVSGAKIQVHRAVEVADPVVAIKELVGVGAGTRPAVTDPGVVPTGGGRAAVPGEPYVHDGDHAWVPSAGSSGALFGAVALLVAFVFDGHTVTGGSRLWTAVADVVHVASGAVWAGGVFMLTAVVWRRHRSGRDTRALQLAIRFSVVATVAVVAAGVAGSILAVIVLDAPSELWSTEWGRTLVVKAFMVLLAAAAGGYNHKVMVPALEQSPLDETLAHRFRMIITGEAAALLAVVVSTAVLMGAAS